MLADAARATKWLRAFRAALPATPSALQRALGRVRAFAQQVHVIEPDGDSEGAVADLDAVILAAVVEGAVIDGDLRVSLEEYLGRTLWWASASSAAHESILALAAQRAANVGRIVGGGPWQTSFYRAGLPLASSIRLRDALVPHVNRLVTVLRSPEDDPDEALLWLATAIAPAAPELAGWRTLTRADLRDALARWLHGEPTETIEAHHPDLWSTVENDLDTLLPWILTALIEYLTTASEDSEIRDLAHRRLGVARLRYGVSDSGLCDHVRRGVDRVVVTRLAAQFAALPPVEQFFQDRDDFITARLNPAAHDDDG
jgi:hypothetical protein